jgi:hypothetical protein
MEYIAVVIKVTPKLFSVMKVHAWRDCITGCIQALRFMWTAAVDGTALVLRSRKIWTVLVLRVSLQEIKKKQIQM